MTTGVDGEKYLAQQESRLRNHFVRYNLPDYMLPGTLRYIVHGIVPGDFLRAVANNDLRRAVDQGDQRNTEALANWVRFFYNAAPMGCWGDSESVKRWCANGGLAGYHIHDQQVDRLCASTD